MLFCSVVMGLNVGANILFFTHFMVNSIILFVRYPLHWNEAARWLSVFLSLFRAFY